jgi:predicted metalloprotease with PDZ domain
MVSLKLFAAVALGCWLALAQINPITINVDASEASRRLIRTTMRFPVTPGPLSLRYPKWIPGEHGPTGPIEDLVGIKVTASGQTIPQTIPWTRDAVNMYEFHLTVPPGVAAIDVSAEFISPPETGGFSSGGSITSQLAVLSWNQFLLYPSGTPTDQLNYRATLKVPEGWRYATALPIESESGNQIVFKPASLTTLVDSPVQTGANFRTVDLNPGGAVPHLLHLAADSERATRISEEEIRHYRNLVQETIALFGASHYRDYHFLYTLSDHIAHFGLEHHESSDDRTDEDALVDEDHRRLAAGLLPHEFVHSWNGKFRRPAGLATADYDAPMKGNLLWVYEGLTEYLGEILTPRSGLSTTQDFFDSVAGEAAVLDREAGRSWRPLEDTAVAAQILYGSRSDYRDLRRSVDYYEEGTLIWLDADVTIRTLSKGRKSLDDFCRLWAGSPATNPPATNPPATNPEVKPYTFEDVVRTLNAVEPHDWAGFLNDRLQSTEGKAPLDGITGGGYNLVYTADRSDFQKNLEATRKIVDLSFSLGLKARADGTIIDVHLDSPAYRTGIAPAGKLIAVNGREFSPEVLRNAVADAVKNTSAIVLIVKDGDYYKTVGMDYHGGNKFPHLVRDKARPDLLSAIIQPRTAQAKR